MATKGFILRRLTAVPRPATVLRSRLVEMAAIVAELEIPLEGKPAPFDIRQAGEVVNLEG